MLALTLPNEDVLFVHYKVPTIIMSRACDQLEKVWRNAYVSLLSACLKSSFSSAHPPNKVTGILDCPVTMVELIFRWCPVHTSPEQDLA